MNSPPYAATSSAVAQSRSHERPQRQRQSSYRGRSSDQAISTFFARPAKSKGFESKAFSTPKKRDEVTGRHLLVEKTTSEKRNDDSLLTVLHDDKMFAVLRSPKLLSSRVEMGTKNGLLLREQTSPSNFLSPSRGYSWRRSLPTFSLSTTPQRRRGGGRRRRGGGSKRTAPDSPLLAQARVPTRTSPSAHLGQHLPARKTSQVDGAKTPPPKNIWAPTKQAQPVGALDKSKRVSERMSRLLKSDYPLADVSDLSDEDDDFSYYDYDYDYEFPSLTENKQRIDDSFQSLFPPSVLCVRKHQVSLDNKNSNVKVNSWDDSSCSTLTESVNSVLSQDEDSYLGCFPTDYSPNTIGDDDCF